MINPSAPLGYGGQPQAPQPRQSPPRGQAPVYGQPPAYGPQPGRGQAPPYGQQAPAWQTPVYGPTATRIQGAPRARRTPRSDPGALVAGLVIAGLGLFFLASQLEPDIGRFVTLFIGLALLAVFVISREYGFLVPGSILTGVGIGIALEPAMSGETESGVMMLALAGGFLGIWVLGSIYRLSQNHWWPLIPGGILTLVGLVQLSRTDVEGALHLWPVILIIAGALVVGRTFSRRP